MPLVIFLLGVLIIYSRIRQWPWLGKDTLARSFWGTLLIGSSFTLMLLAVYFTWKLTALTAILSFVLLVLAALVVPIQKSPLPLKLPKWSPDTPLMWLCIAFLADALLLGMLILARTDAPLVSPWNLFSLEPFLLWGASTLLLFIHGKRTGNLSLIIGIFHLFVGLSVSAILYKVGFGFDPFLHRAAEEQLVLHGVIQPQQLLYSGQYVLISALHFLTGFSVRIIDIWLLPLLASVLLPIGAYIGLRDGWGFKETEAKTWWMCILLLPFMLATFTVPFTWTYVWFLLVLFILPVAKYIKATRGILLLTSIAMVTFQPLLAVPVCVWILGFILFTSHEESRITRYFTLTAIPLFTMAAMAAIFAYYQHSIGMPIILAHIFDRISAFTQLFQNPFYDPYPNIPFFLNAIYDIRHWSPIVMILIASGVYAYHARTMPFLKTYLAFLLGMLGSILIISTLFYFKNIIAGEQLEFSKRLLTALYAASLPAFTLLGRSMPTKWQLPAFVLATTLILHAWYFSYPQFNQKYPFYSASVSAANVEAVQYIDQQAAGLPYIVLSDQMTSAAAIQEFHFAHYYTIQGEQILWYPIPTGGPLYALYSRLMSGESPKEIMYTLHEETGVSTFFLVLPTYWDWDKEILNRFEDASDHTHKTSDGYMTIYTFPIHSSLSL